MIENELNWAWYHTFLKVLETGSLSAAGRAIGLTQPTVGRHIDCLENALGLKLFIRSFDGFAPTDAALELKPYAASLATTAAALRRVASGHSDGVSGTVRLTASEVIAVEVLPPILSVLRLKHPQLVIELVLSSKIDDLLHREADIAVRMLRPTQEVLVAKRMGNIELGLHASRSYLKKYGEPQSIDELGQHSLIGFDQENAFIRKIQDQFPALFARSSLALRTDSDLAQLAAIRSGFGIGVCQSALAAKDKTLVRILPRDFSWYMDTWLAMHEDLRASPRCAATFSELAQGLSAYIQGA